MELVYLWVGSYKNIGKDGKGFNFSSKYLCSGDIDNLNIVPKEESDEKYIENFFSDYLNITAIIGENGSGKSTILECLIDDSNFGSGFLIYEEKGVLYIKGDEHGIVNANIDLQLKEPYDNLICTKINIDDTINHGEYADNLDNLIIKTLKVLSQENDVLKYFDKRFIFDKLIIEIKRDSIISESLFEKNKYNLLLKNLRDVIIRLISQKVKEPKPKTQKTKYKNNYMYSTNDIELDIKISFLIKYIKGLYDFTIMDMDKQKVFIDNVDKTYFKDLTFLNMFELIKKFEEEMYQLESHKNRNLKAIQAYEKLIKFFNNFDKKDFITRNEYGYELSIQFDIEEELDNINYIINELDSCYLDNSEFKCLEFQFYSYRGNVILSELSSGEQSLIAKYIGIIYQILFSRSDILLIDEPDVFLHPKWAKEFLNNLINIISKNELLKEKKIHLILTSHSPFIISDLPKQNILFLKDGKQVKGIEKKQTFGANIHTLLSDSFFMEKGLMGEFAKGKINEIKEFYEKAKIEKKTDKNVEFYDKHKEKFWQIQKIIGEPFLQTVIKNYLDEIENILFEDKAKKIAIERFIKEFGEEAISEVMNNAKN